MDDWFLIEERECNSIVELNSTIGELVTKYKKATHLSNIMLEAPQTDEDKYYCEVWLHKNSMSHIIISFTDNYIS